jgi:hypothetical protein
MLFRVLIKPLRVLIMLLRLLIMLFRVRIMPLRVLMMRAKRSDEAGRAGACARVMRKRISCTSTDWSAWNWYLSVITIRQCAGSYYHTAMRGLAGRPTRTPYGSRYHAGA